MFLECPPPVHGHGPYLPPTAHLHVVSLPVRHPFSSNSRSSSNSSSSKGQRISSSSRSSSSNSSIIGGSSSSIISNSSSSSSAGLASLPWSAIVQTLAGVSRAPIC